MKGFIEFKFRASSERVEKAFVPVANIASIETCGVDTCKIYVRNPNGNYYSVAEPYEEIIKKIKEAEEQNA